MTKQEWEVIQWTGLFCFGVFLMTHSGQHWVGVAERFVYTLNNGMVFL